MYMICHQIVAIKWNRVWTDTLIDIWIIIIKPFMHVWQTETVQQREKIDFHFGQIGSHDKFLLLKCFPPNFDRMGNSFPTALCTTLLFGWVLFSFFFYMRWATFRIFNIIYHLVSSNIISHLSDFLHIVCFSHRQPCICMHLNTNLIHKF